MAHSFTRSGFSVQYPDNWTVESEDTDEGWSTTIASPETAFMLLSHYDDHDEAGALADMALDAMRESYPDLETVEIVETLAGRPAVGHDVEFIALDLTNTCWIRALTGPQGALLLMGQCTDTELETNGEVLKAICASLTVADAE